MAFLDLRRANNYFSKLTKVDVFNHFIVIWDTYKGSYLLPYLIDDEL